MMANDQNLNRPSPKAGIMDIAAYVPGKETVAGVAKIYKLSANETPFGPSPHALEAYRHAAERLSIYPDGQATVLREAIAQVNGLNPANIICGNGSDEILSLICHTYLSAGDESIITQHGFAIYEIQTLAAGGKAIKVEEKDYRVDVDAILAAVTPRTKIVFIANPANPTGTYLPFAEVKRLHAGLPKNVILVLDAAYAEYVRRNDFDAGIELVSANENVVMTRTFSKIHGLSALRIGWGYAPLHMIDAMNRIRGPFNMNGAALAAGAAAIRDRNHVETSVAYNSQWAEWLTEELTKIGLQVTPSVTNFLLIHFPDDAAKSAAKADEWLSSYGYILRRVGGYGFPNALRLTIGPEEANRGVIAALTEFMKQ